MRNRPYLLWICIAAGIAMFPLGAHGRGRNIPTYDGRVEFGAQLLHRDGGCVFVDGSVTSGEFFNELKRISIGDHFEFRHRGKSVAEYPESLAASIRIMGNQCGALAAPTPGLFAEGTYALKLVAAWKDGVEMKPARISPESVTCTGYNSVTIPDRGFAIPTVTCQLKIQADRIPLSDHLILSIFTEDGAQLTRLSAAP
jgi:hypothetical protein